MKKTKKMLMVSGIILATSGIFAAGSVVYQLLPTNLPSWAQTIGSSEEAVDQEDTIGLVATGFSGDVKEKADTEAPVITKEDVTIDQGTEVSLLENVTAKDNVDGDLTKKIETDGEVDFNTPGTYPVKLAVTDSSGNKATAEKVITINEVQPVVETTPVDNPVYEESGGNAPAAPAESTPAPAQSQNSAPAYSAMTMYIGGAAIPYQNGGQGSGQSIIDGNPYGTISTWGGAATQSGSDGLNTHFIGHNPGIFSSIFSLGQGSQITVTDGNGTPTVYTVSTILRVNDSAVGINDGQNYWSLVTGTGGGERISLQSCIDDSTNLIVIAYA